MKYSTSTTLLSLVATVSAATTIPVAVGQGGLNFNPNSFTANEGDTVVFHFYSGSGFGSHSVAMSSFDTPCSPATGGFYSGTIMGNTQGDRTFTITINSTDTQYIYCSVGSHCQKGMVAIINPSSNSNQNIDAFVSAAMGAQRVSSPSQIEGGIVATGGASATSAASSAASSSSMAMTSSMSMASSMSSSMAMSSSAASMSKSMSSSAAAGGAGGAMTSSSRAASGTGTPAASSPSVAATTTSGGQKSEWSVVLGLTVVVGGLAALMS